MLRYDGSSLLGTVFVFYGGVMPRLVRPIGLYIVFVSVLYIECEALQFSISTDGLKFIGAATTFMLVFRLNQCYSRLTEGNKILVNAIRSLRCIIALVCSQLSFNERSKALSEEERQAATATKVHVCRLATAFAVSLKFHMRVSEMMNRGGSGEKQELRFALYDLLRIKALLTAAEARLVERHSGLFEAQVGGWTGSKPVFEVDVHKHVEARSDTRPVFTGGDGEHAGGCAVPPMIMQFLRSALMEPLCRPWGYPERVLNLYEMHCGTATQSFQEMNQMVLFSLPLPYVQLCKVLLVTFIVAYPLSIDLGHGVWGNIVVPTILAIAMLGFEKVADMMENPFGDDSADISVYETIHEFEVEAQALFDSSQPQRPALLQSSRDLEHSCGLPLGSEKLSQAEVCAAHSPAFADFFEWTPLPHHLVDYIVGQSTDVKSLNSVWHGWGCDWGRCCKRRRETRRQRHVKRNAMVEELVSDDNSDASEETTTIDDVLPSFSSRDRFAIRRCVALRADLPHLRAAKAQTKALLSQNLRSLTTFSEVLAGATAAAGH